MRKLLSTLLVTTILSGCSGSTTVPVKPETHGLKYVPINLIINKGTQNSNSLFVSWAIDYIYRSINESKLFSKVRTMGNNYQHTLNIDYTWEDPDQVRSFAGDMISGLTLLTLPVKRKEKHSISIKIIRRGSLVFSNTYSDIFDVNISLFHDPKDERHKCINDLLKRFYKDLKDKNIMPYSSGMKIVLDNRSS